MYWYFRSISFIIKKQQNRKEKAVSECINQPISMNAR